VGNPARCAESKFFRPRDNDRELLERAREIVKLAKKFFAESDPSILLGYKREPPSESQ
jgi:hypothetical protein